MIQNLLINAAQAMPRGGTIIISAENLELDSTRAAVDLPTESYVMVRVQDQGTGIAPSDLTRIFDPYFSTKPEGHGLGLTTTHSIIRKHGGFIMDLTMPGGMGGKEAIQKLLEIDPQGRAAWRITSVTGSGQSC